MSTLFYAQTAGILTTNSSTPIELPGLSITIPPWTHRPLHAIITVNIPNPYATGHDFPGGYFRISVNGSLQEAIGAFTYNEKVPDSTGRIPVTLITKVDLPSTSQPAIIAVMWSGIRGSTVHIDSPSSVTVQLF